MTRAITTIVFLLCTHTPCFAQQEIKVNPASVNVYSQGATTIFLTYGNLGNYRPVETAWCGDLIPASPDIGFRCAPGTIYGALPKRYDISRRSGTGGYTDIVSVPAAIARKAYQAAAAGQASEFFYVRRFVSAGGSDQFVAVTMRLTGNGAAAPFSLADVQLGFGASTGASATGSDPLVLFVEPGGKIPPIRAEIKYTGAGRLKGQYLILLRIEASDDGENGSDLSVVGAGVVNGGAAAGFPMPVLRYVVGGGESAPGAARGAGQFPLLLPRDGATLPSNKPVDFVWGEMPQAVFYRLEIEDHSGKPILSALLRSNERSYRAPSWLKSRAGNGDLRWRVVALDGAGAQIGETARYDLRLANGQ